LIWYEGTMKINIPSHLSDAELVAELTSLASRERGATAHLIAHLAEFDARRLYLAAGFPSLFAYCTEVLRLSEPEAYNRIEAARAARRFPVILDRLTEGCLTMTTVRILASRLTADNHGELLAAASGKTRREVEELVARYFPQPDVAFSVRELPAPRTTPAPLIAAASTPAAIMTPASAPVTAPAATVPAPAAPAPRPAVVAPLAPDRYQIRFTASAQTCEKLRLAQDMLRHAVPTGDTAEIIDRALSLLVEDLARKKFAATDRPRVSRGAAAGSRYVAAKVRRAVWIRDYGRCAYVAKSGHRCNSRSFVEFHHLDPYGVGGEATVETMELRCRAHNNYEAELFYGRRQPPRSGKRVRHRDRWRRPGSRRARANGAAAQFTMRE
jgi:hypothetical protein